MTNNAGGQEIVEELDALALLASSPRDGDLRAHNPMSPSSTDWSRALGWAGQPLDNANDRFSQSFAERPNSPPPAQESRKPPEMQLAAGVTPYRHLTSSI